MFWWLSQRSVGSGPGHGTCVLEQDALLIMLLFIPLKSIVSCAFAGVPFAKLQNKVPLTRGKLLFSFKREILREKLLQHKPVFLLSVHPLFSIASQK